MPRLIPIMLSLLCSLSPTLAAPVPTHLMKPAVGYYPTIAGTKLVYDRGGHEEVRIVMKVEPKDGGHVVTTETIEAGGMQSPFHKVLVNAKGVFILERYGDAYDPPHELLRLPYQANNKWEMAGTWGTSKHQEVRKTTKEEIIKVPAGEFKCIRVESQYTQGGGTSTSTHWYAVGVGVVKVDYGGGSELILKSFTPGK